jgi:hypothetical protein
MRLVFVLLIGGALVWAYLKFFPGGEPQAGAPQGGRTEVVEPVQPQGPTAEAQLPGDQLPGDQPPAALPDVAGNPFAPSAAAERNARALRVRLAEALAHGADERIDALLLEAEGVLAVAQLDGVQALRMALAGDVPEARDVGRSALVDGGLPAGERALVAAALGAGEVPRPEGAPRAPLERAMAIRLHEALARIDAAQGRHRDAATRLGHVVELEFGAPWSLSTLAMEDWARRLREAQQRHRWDPRGEWNGLELEAQPGDSWISLRKRAIAEVDGLVMSAGLVAWANGTNLGGTLRRGQKVRVPLDPVSIEVDLSQRWMLYRLGDEVVDAWRVGVGRPGEETITGEFVIGNKQENPVHWSDSGPIPFGDPENALGTRWLGWRVEGDDADTAYGFHGTWEPESIGGAASEGCVRMYNEDVERLFEILPSGAQVVVHD